MYDWSTPIMTADGVTEMVQWIGQDGSKDPPGTLGVSGSVIHAYVTDLASTTVQWSLDVKIKVRTQFII